MMRFLRFLVGFLVLPGLVWAQATVINGNRVHAGWVNYGTTAGTPTAYTLTFSPPLPGYVEGQCFLFKPHLANTGAATLNVQGKGALPLRKLSGTSLVPLDAGDLVVWRLMWACHDGATLQLMGAASEGTGGGTGITDGDKGDILVDLGGTRWVIEDRAVSYVKLPQATAGARLLGRGSAGAGDWQEISLGANCAMGGGGTVLNCTGGTAGGISDNDYGDITVSLAGTRWTVDSTLTLTGAANQVTVSPSTPQTMAANRTWTFTLPQNIDTAALARYGSLGLNGAAPASPGQLSQTAGANNLTLHTLRRATDTAPTGNFVLYQNAAGASVWQVDIHGVLALGNVPAGRITGGVTGAQIATNTLTYGHLQPTTVPAVLLGRNSGSAGNVHEVTLGANLAMSPTGVLSATGGPGGGGGDVTTATSLATSHYVGDATVGRCTWAEGGEVFDAACDAAKTALFTSDIVMYGSTPMALRNTDGDACATVNNVTGLTTYHATNACERPSISRPFDALAFNVGTGVTIETMSLNGWPGVPVLDGPNTDAGTFSLVIPVLWRDFAPAGLLTLQLTCHSIANQNGLTLIVRVGAAVCTADNEALPAFVAPNAGTPLVCTFGNQAQDVQMSNIVTLTTTGCAAGERMSIPFASEADMTAGWSTTTSVITGGLLTYETVGTP